MPKSTPVRRSIDCPRCGNAIAHRISNSRRDFPYKLTPGVQLQARDKQAPRLRCRCGQLVIVLKASVA